MTLTGQGLLLYFMTAYPKANFRIKIIVINEELYSKGKITAENGEEKKKTQPCM